MLAGVLVGFLLGRRSFKTVRPDWFLRGRRRVSDDVWNNPRFWSEQAEQAFDRALRHGEQEKHDGDMCLISFDEVVSGRMLTREDRGFQTVPIAKIVGSVGKACWFTKSFDPKREDQRGRWKRSYAIAHGLIGHEPIDLYQLGTEFFVVDGHFRVSVTKALGGESIRAHVQGWL